MYCSRQRQRAARARCWSSRNFLETFVSGRLVLFLLCRISPKNLPPKPTHTHEYEYSQPKVSSCRCFAHSFVIINSLRFVVSFSSFHNGYSSTQSLPVSCSRSKSFYVRSLRTSFSLLHYRSRWLHTTSWQSERLFSLSFYPVDI